MYMDMKLAKRFPDIAEFSCRYCLQLNEHAWNTLMHTFGGHPKPKDPPLTTCPDHKKITMTDRISAGTSLEGQLMYTNPRFKQNLSAVPLIATPPHNPKDVYGKVKLPRDRVIIEYDDRNLRPDSIADYAQRVQTAEEFHSLWTNEIMTDLLQMRRRRIPLSPA